MLDEGLRALIGPADVIAVAHRHPHGLVHGRVDRTGAVQAQGPAPARSRAHHLHLAEQGVADGVDHLVQVIDQLFVLRAADVVRRHDRHAHVGAVVETDHPPDVARAEDGLAGLGVITDGLGPRAPEGALDDHRLGDGHRVDGDLVGVGAVVAGLDRPAVLLQAALHADAVRAGEGLGAHQEATFQL